MPITSGPNNFWNPALDATHPMGEYDDFRRD
jgi:hypothetical protein